MIETPQTTDTALRHTAVLALTVTRADMPHMVGPGIREVLDAVAAQGLTPTGPWFTHHLRRPTDTFDFEICVPVAQPIVPQGRVRPGQWPAMRVVRTVHHGSYEGLGAAWGEFMGWIDDKGLQTAEDLWEVYTVGPASGSDPTLWRTELNRQLPD